MYIKETLLCTFFLLIFSFVYAANVELEPIVIEKSTGVPLSQFSILDDAQLDSIPAQSLIETLEYYPGVQLRTRSAFGVQSDLSIRGSNFEDDSVLINGVRINDPQTGHFNLILPFTLADIEYVALDAAGGEVNFVTKPPQGKSVMLKSSYAEHALFSQLLSCTFEVSKTANRISYEYATSSGARQDTDFDIWNVSLDSLYKGAHDTFEFIFAATSRDYGAGNFYTTAFPHQEEQLKQQLFMVAIDNVLNNSTLHSSALLKRQTDKFILNRHNPAFFTNFHTTYIYDVGTNLIMDNNVFFGANVGREKITSTNLARRSRNNQSLSAGLALERYNKILFGCALHLAHHDESSWQQKVDSTIGWYFTDSLVSRLRVVYDWRVPSFTELYYQSPSNIGNESLDVQDDFNVELNTDFDIHERIAMHGALFLKHQHNTIDWVKNAPAQAWQATNIGRIKTRGIECGVDFRVERLLDSVTLGYTYLDINRQNSYLFSKYIFNYLKHAFSAQWLFKFSSYSLSVITDFNKPIARDNYTKVDVVLKKRINAHVTLFIEGTNVLDADFLELPGIEGDPSWFECGIELRF